jgi:hypothetical protein
MQNKELNGNEILTILQEGLGTLTEEMGEYKFKAYLDHNEIPAFGNTFLIYVSSNNTRCAVFDWKYYNKHKDLYVASDFTHDFDCRAMLNADRLFLIATVGKVLENAGYKGINYEGQSGI